MNILPELLKKYKLNTEVSQIFNGNIFYHLDSVANPRQTLFVYDTNILDIIETYRTPGAISLNLAKPRAHPTLENMAKVVFFIKTYKISQIFAFGTGAINDICKYVAFLSGVHYTFCPTAFSMNGIVSQNVSLIDNKRGIKQSISAKPAKTIIIEQDIVMNAPRRFIGSAIMDSLAAYTACNDFIFASQLDSKKYPFKQKVFSIFHAEMVKIIDIVENNTEALYTDFNIAMQVFEVLYLSGCIMNYYESSIAFSGGEHHIAHTLESKYPEISEHFLHGEVISAILPFYSQIQKDYTKNNYIPKNIIEENNRIDFRKIATKLQLPEKPQDLGISQEKFMECVKNAKYAKERPTILSLLF